ncbi:unnamed protein product [Lota lota]
MLSTRLLLFHAKHDFIERLLENGAEAWSLDITSQLSQKPSVLVAGKVVWRLPWTPQTQRLGELFYGLRTKVEENTSTETICDGETSQFIKG